MIYLKWLSREIHGNYTVSTFSLPISSSFNYSQLSVSIIPLKPLLHRSPLSWYHIQWTLCPPYLTPTPLGSILHTWSHPPWMPAFLLLWYHSLQVFFLPQWFLFCQLVWLCFFHYASNCWCFLLLRCWLSSLLLSFSFPFFYAIFILIFPTWIFNIIFSSELQTHRFIWLLDIWVISNEYLTVLSNLTHPK
jgi:hypothetical protein